MEGSPESGVDLAILGITRFPMEEEDGRIKQMAVDRYKGPHHKWVYLSADRRG